MGLALQCRRMLDKKSRGITSMRGRRSAESEREAALISDAGLQLSLAACNSSLALSFGLPADSLRIDIHELEQRGLPSPGLAILWPHEVLEKNFILADQRWLRVAQAPKRDLNCEILCGCEWFWHFFCWSPWVCD